MPIVTNKISLCQLFTEVLDVFGKPGRRFYDFLSLCSNDEKEKNKLKYLLTKEGNPELRE